MSPLSQIIGRAFSLKKKIPLVRIRVSESQACDTTFKSFMVGQCNCAKDYVIEYQKKLQNILRR